MTIKEELLADAAWCRLVARRLRANAWKISTTWGLKVNDYNIRWNEETAERLEREARE